MTDEETGSTCSETHVRLFFEDINFAADGARHGELVKK